MDVPGIDRTAQADMLAGTSAATRQLLQSCPIRTFEKNQDVYARIDETSMVLLLIAGRMKVARTTSSGQSATICNLGVGDALGLPSCMLGSPLDLEVTTLTRVRAACWPAALVERLLAQDPAFARNALTVLSDYLRLIIASVEARVGDVGRRTASALLSLSVASRRWSVRDDQDLAVTRQEIADMIGSTVASVSRTLTGWERAGLVSGGRGTVRLLDHGALATIAEAEGRSPDA